MPLAFDKFGDWRPAGLFYLSGLSQTVLGSSEFAVRLPTALFGALSVFPLFSLATLIYKRKEAGYLAGFLLAVLPWHLVLSRAAHEAVVGYFLILGGLVYLFKYLEEKSAQDKYLIFGYLLILFSYLFYHGTRVLAPLILLPLVFVFRGKTAVKLFAVFLILTLLIIVSPFGKGRLSQIIFYKNPGILKKIEELPYADAGNLTAARIFHNKPVVYARELVGNYLQYFSSDFLFMRGGYPKDILLWKRGFFILF